MYTCICVPVEYLSLNRIILNSDCCHASNRHSACRGRTLARGPGILGMFSRLRGRHLRNGSSSPQGAACPTPLGMWRLCTMVGVALSSHRPLLTGGASTRGAKKRSAHILVYIQISAFFGSRAHAARAQEAGSDGSAGSSTSPATRRCELSMGGCAGHPWCAFFSMASMSNTLLLICEFVTGRSSRILGIFDSAAILIISE